MKRKLIYITIAGVLIGLGYLNFYFHQYHIKDNPKAIQSNLTSWLNRDNVPHDPQVLDFVELGQSNAYLALVQYTNKRIGYAEFTKGWNGRYKIAQSAGTEAISYYDIKTNKGTYGILYGTNPKSLLNTVKVKLSNANFSYMTKVPDKKHFIVYKQLTGNLSDTRVSELFYYDKNNKSISLSELSADVKLTELNVN